MLLSALNLLLGFSGILATEVVAYLYSRKRKALSLRVVAKVKAASLNAPLDGRLQIFLDGKPVKDVTIIAFTLESSGNVHVDSSDFVRPFELQIHSPARILNASVAECDPSTLGAVVTFTERKVVLSPLLLNAGDVVTFTAVVEEFSNSIAFDARIRDVNKVTYRVKEVFNWIDTYNLALLVAAFLIFLARDLTPHYRSLGTRLSLVLFFLFVASQVYVTTNQIKASRRRSKTLKSLNITSRG